MSEFSGRFRFTEPGPHCAEPTAGCATLLMTQTEAPETMGSGAPKRHPVSEQFRLLPVSPDVAAASVKAFPRQLLTFVRVLPESGTALTLAAATSGDTGSNRK